MEQKRVDYSCFISWYNNREKSLYQRREKKGQFQKVGCHLPVIHQQNNSFRDQELLILRGLTLSYR